MTTSEITYQHLQQQLAHEHDLLAKELRHEMQLNTLVPSAAEIQKTDINELITIAKSSCIPNLFNLALRLEKVDAAVCSVKMGMYGLCVDCEDEIEMEALQADPAQPRCRSCRTHSRYHHN